MFPHVVFVCLLSIVYLKQLVAILPYKEMKRELN